MTKLLTLCLVALLFPQSARDATAQEQKLRDTAGFVEGAPIYLSWGVGREEYEKVLEQARSFLWSNWQRKQRAHVAVKDCAIYPEGCDDHKTYDFYVEPDGQGSWRIRMETEHIVVGRPAEGRKAETTRYRDVFSTVERLGAGGQVSCGSVFREPSTAKPDGYRLRLTSRRVVKEIAVHSCVLI